MLARWQKTVVDPQGNIVPSAQLIVRRESDQALATVYRDREGTNPYPSGLVTADANGYAYFYADVDFYRITSAEPVIDWRDVEIGGSAALKGALSEDDGASNIGYRNGQTVLDVLDAVEKRIECVHDLVGRNGQDGDRLRTMAYWPGWAGTLSGIPMGGASFVWDSARVRSEHNGGNIVSPTVPWDGAESTFADFLAGAGETNPGALGCWVHSQLSPSSGFDVTQWGARNDASSNGANDAMIQPMLDYLEQSISGGRGSRVLFPRGSYRFSKSFHVRDRQALVGEGTDGTVIQFVGSVEDHCIYLGPTGPNHPLNPNGHHVFATRLESMSISGANVYQGFDRAMVYTDGAHEHSGLFNCVVRDFVSIGVYYNTGNGGPALFEISDIEIYGSNTAPAVGEKRGVRCDAGGAIVLLRHATITGGPDHKLSTGVLMQKDNLIAMGVHLENAIVGISLAQSDASAPRVNSLIGITGKKDVTKLVGIGSNFEGSITAQALVNKSLDTTGLIVLDNAKTQEVYEDTAVPSYMYPRQAGGALATARINVSGGTVTVPHRSGMPFSASRTAVGVFRFVFNKSIAVGADYAVLCNARPSGGGAMFCEFSPINSTTFDLKTYSQSGVAADPVSIWFSLSL